MARGFESKDVEFQQDEAERRRTKRGGPFHDGDVRPFPGRDGELKRDIELLLRRVRRERELAIHPAHRHMLEEAIADLERRLASGDCRQ